MPFVPAPDRLPPLATPARRRKVALLGATGSIGQSTLRVLRAHGDKLELVAIAAARRGAELAAIAGEFQVPWVVLAEPAAAAEIAPATDLPAGARLLTGTAALAEVAALAGADLVLVSMVGTAGLAPTLAALRAGRTVALASKEVLVLGGPWVMEAARTGGGCLLPVDSEHNAIFQCLVGCGERADVARLVLTASGGPFRTWSAERMADITVADALKHPTWNMGQKVTIDSATLANKGLELIEARWLFGVEPQQLEVVVHPQSIVHSMVEYVDGSVLAQLSPPSMTFAIQYALLYPARATGVHDTLDFRRASTLEFFPPDEGRFPCLRLAKAALAHGGAAPAIFNAANEVAVAAFVAGQLPFAGIPRVIEATLGALASAPATSLDDVLAADAAARRVAAAAT